MFKFINNFNIYDKINILFLSIIALISRYPLIEKIQSHWDGPQYSIAIIRYSFQEQTPAPPGYPLYILFGKLFYYLTSNPHLSMLLVSVSATVIASIVIYVVGKLMYHRIVGLTASLIFLSGSTFYYFGLTPYAYIFTPITSTLLAFIVYQIYIKRVQIGIIFGIIFGISFGIRPQESLLFFPIILLGFIYLKRIEKIKFIIVFFIITLMWLIPSLLTIGYTEYFYQSYIFFKGALLNNSLQHRIELILKGFLLSFGISSIFLTYYFYKLIKFSLLITRRNISFIIFYSLWLIPAFLYNLILRTEHAGYQMSYLAGFLILISFAIWKVTQKSKLLYLFIILIIVVFNLYWFFYNRDPNYIKPYRPTSFHYSDIRKNDLKTGSKINYILSNFSSNETLIITNSVLWRVYGYYLKDYTVISLEGLVDNNPKFYHRILTMNNWNMKENINKNLQLIIPKNIKYIVFPDDENYLWIKNKSFKIASLPGNSKITILFVNSGDQIIYKYHYLKVTSSK